MRISISQNLPIRTLPEEVVERKGIGHPDTICDAVSEAVSRALCTYYLENFGAILHHNVDKALLVGGASTPAFGGGLVRIPMELILAGRATHLFQGKEIPVADIAETTARAWFKANMRHVHPEKHVQFTVKIRPGSSELTELFHRDELPRCNDTSIGVGYFPLSFCEARTLEVESFLNSAEIKQQFPFIGEDIKVLGLREKDRLRLTVAIAMVDAHLFSMEEYLDAKRQIKALLSTTFDIPTTDIALNAADKPEKNSIYLTVTGTSAESGDDGQVGRGNRLNGLITPYRPMTLEAFAGKNPLTHVGKTYNFFAMNLAKALVEEQFAAEAQVILASQIGQPVHQPQFVDIQLRNAQVAESVIREFVQEKLASLPSIWKQILASPVLR